MRKQKDSENRFLSIFVGFGNHLGPPKRSQGVQKSMLKLHQKFDQFLKASWNATFSAQEPPSRASAADRRRRWSRPGPSGGGFRREKTRTFENLSFGRLALEGLGRTRRPGFNDSARRPRWAADCRRLRLGTAAPIQEDMGRFSKRSHEFSKRSPEFSRRVENRRLGNAKSTSGGSEMQV